MEDTPCTGQLEDLQENYQTLEKQLSGLLEENVFLHSQVTSLMQEYAVLSAKLNKLTGQLKQEQHAILASNWQEFKLVNNKDDRNARG